MPTKLGRKQVPSGYSAKDFTYKGRPSSKQDDFGDDVGIADLACVDQFGGTNSAKYYHGGVVQSSDGKWWVYVEWGRIREIGTSWDNGVFCANDFQFTQCVDEGDARKFFKKQLQGKNIKRLEHKTVNGIDVWAGKNGKSGYLVQSLATRERGLPDAYSIKDSTGVTQTKKKKVKSKTKTKLTRNYHPEELKLVNDLVGGTTNYTRALIKSSGVSPTMQAITEVRDDLIPAALKQIGKVGTNITDQINDRDLKDISKMVYAMVPQNIPHGGLTPEEAILNSNTMFKLQQDLDAFEAALNNEDFSATVSDSNTVDPDVALGAKLVWLDPREKLGAWVVNTFRAMTKNRHGDISNQKLHIKNIFSIERDIDKTFVAAVNTLAKKNKNTKYGDVAAGLQPKKRSDLSDISDTAKKANVFIGIHGTRGVNISPILQSHLRLPKSLSGVQISGAAFGHGIYFATDWKKSYGYTGHSGRWGNSGGGIASRGFFMFLADVAGGRFHYPNKAWGLNTATCPDGKDTVYAHPKYISSLQNDEHVIFNPEYCRLRYLIEGELR